MIVSQENQKPNLEQRVSAELDGTESITTSQSEQKFLYPSVAIVSF